MLERIKANNRLWAERMVQADEQVFRRLEQRQTPEYFWIGCSDSRVPANQIVGLGPGEIFVHRNVANLAGAQDMNFLCVLEYAVEALKVRHILVVGHYGCGGVAAAADKERRGILDHWLHPIRAVMDDNRRDLATIKNARERLDRLCELNVIQQVRNVSSTVIVQDAWRKKQDLHVHGLIYSLGNGLLNDLDVTMGP
ncbi:MAG: carbonic anhydrase [Hyphomicrobiales bacterium]